MNKIFRYATAIILASSLFITSCNESSPAPEEPTASLNRESALKQVQFINFNRHQVVTTDGWAINITDSTVFIMHRPSCSGFNVSEIGDKDFRLSVIGAIQFEYDLSSPENNLGMKRVNATRFTVWRKDCLETPPSVVYYPDTDRDRYADHEDAYPNDPTRH